MLRRSSLARREGETLLQLGAVGLGDRDACPDAADLVGAVVGGAVGLGERGQGEGEQEGEERGIVWDSSGESATEEGSEREAGNGMITERSEEFEWADRKSRTIRSGREGAR